MYAKDFRLCTWCVKKDKAVFFARLKLKFLIRVIMPKRKDQRNRELKPSEESKELPGNENQDKELPANENQDIATSNFESEG